MKKNRIVYLDMLNICSCFCVIWLHCNGISHTFTDTLAWRQSLFVEVAAYWAVPVFFMLTGATLMTYRNNYNTKTFFIKRFQRVFIPFIAWSIIVFIWKLATDRYHPDSYSIRDFVNIFINNKMEGVYWFFLPLFMIYLSLPVLSLLTEDIHRKWLWYMVGMAVLTISFLPLVFKVFKLDGAGKFAFPLTGGCILFTILGYLLSTQTIIKPVRLAIYSFGIFNAALRFGVTYNLSVRDQSLNRLLYGYTLFPSVFLAIAVFVGFKHFNWDLIDNIRIVKTLRQHLSSCSFGIYLIHMIVITYTLEISGWQPSRFLWRTIGAVYIYLVSFFIILVLKRIPGIKRIVP